MWLSALKWTNSGATSVLNHVSAGCFSRMTGYGGRLWRTSSVNALWPHWSVFWACCRPLRSWYRWRMAGRCMNHAWRESCTLSASVTLSALSDIIWIWDNICKAGTEVTVVLKIGGVAWQGHRALSEHKTLSVSWSHYLLPNSKLSYR